MIQAGVILPLWRRSGSGALDAAENDYDDQPSMWHFTMEDV
jgi:hypothetical protein